jgi:guanosine-3',5'-bis(diphosphate) 3'-pyrophosphohydrolase
MKPNPSDPIRLFQERETLAMHPAVPWSPATVELLFDALAFAAHKHQNQRRKGDEEAPYITHPIAVARVLAVEAGLQDGVLLAAAVLHDTLEDTDSSHDELTARFGLAVADLVGEVSDDKGLSKAERKRRRIQTAAAMSQGARLLLLADKICNLRDIIANPPRGWDVERKREYFDWAHAVVMEIEGTHTLLEEIFQAAYAARP